ncbi:MAG: hypothetical protein HYX53_04765 [Chloroflexi bacterium]|nr:hypothetical protein [Chloroflexota bacterium]
MWRTGTIAFVATLGILAAACGGGGGSGETTVRETSDGLVGVYVGQVEGLDAFIGIAVTQDGRTTRAYVCDGNQVSQWFSGTAEARSLKLTAESASLEAELTKSSAKGTVQLADGRKLNFTAAAAKGDAGLYRAVESSDDGKLVAGWVVLNNGEQRGSVAFTPVPIPRVGTDGLAANPAIGPRPGVQPAPKLNTQTLQVQLSIGSTPRLATVSRTSTITLGP